ncbi:uncharacterized protein LOC133185829 [Saccostrea echinata]|uniref:uncharacterized protein LOC133185829 n=1 Tax=Saccostrea echinata TaxID=191078 RepID=UPI002A82AEC8|nr:uncharacterized protein LOC133185829 [Saccostrea echinata]
MSVIGSSILRYDDELKRRLEKLSRIYDFSTMKIFMTVEALGEDRVCATYNPSRRDCWESFLNRKEACRLDLNKHEKIRVKYQDFLHNVSREDQGKQFHASMMSLFYRKGAADAFGQVKEADSDSFSGFCNHLCRLFEKKICSWFDGFEAAAVKLTGHVKVSNFVRVLSGQVDALCQRDGCMCAVAVKVTGMDSLRPLDLAELAFCKTLIVQNGLADPFSLKMCVLCLHLTNEKPILRLWEYSPTEEMEQSIAEADIDKMIDSGRLSQYHEFWVNNVHLPVPGYVSDKSTKSTYGSSRG